MDKNKILLLLQSGLNSQEISEKLNLDKLEILLEIIVQLKQGGIN